MSCCRQTDFPVTDETRRPFGCGGMLPPVVPYIPVPGPVGPQGPQGPYLTALNLFTEGGAVTGGTATLSDGTAVTVTVTELPN